MDKRSPVDQSVKTGTTQEDQQMAPEITNSRSFEGEKGGETTGD